MKPSQLLARCALSLALLSGMFVAPAQAGGGSSGAGTDVPGEVLVKLASSSALQPLLAKYPLAVADRFGARPIFRLKIIGAARVRDIVAALSLEPGVLIAESNAVQSAPEAHRIGSWAIGSAGVYAAQWAPQAMRFAEAQRLSTGAGMRVAVLDTGVDRSHALLAGRLLPGFDFVDFDADPSERGSTLNLAFGHGTHVAGLVAMAAPGAKILPIRVLDPDGAGNSWVLGEGLLYAIDPDRNPLTDDGAQVVNLSLGTLTRTRLLAAISKLSSCDPEIPGDPVSDRSDPGYNDDRTRCALGHAPVIVAAAGNDSSGNVKEYPAAETGNIGLLAIGASNASGRLAWFTNFGSWVGMAAPGDGVTSAVPGGAYGTWSGTSMATPLVAGTVALVRAISPAARPQDIIQRIRRASAPLCGTPLRMVDAAAAVTNIAGPQTRTCP